MKKNLILVLNCGSSSVKFAVIDPQTSLTSLSGLVQRIGSSEADIKYSLKEETRLEPLPNIDYHNSLKTITTIIKNNAEIADNLLAIGHRIVHGGEQFTHSVIVTEKVLQTIRDCVELAQLHNPANILGIEGALSGVNHFSLLAIIKIPYFLSNFL